MQKPRQPKLRGTSLLKRFDKVNLEYFGGLVCGGIGWRNFPLSAKTLSQAKCYFEERFIKVNQVLDDTRVPLWYLDFVLYHEMLHLQHGPQQFSEDGYAYPHDLRFQCLEVRHPHYHKAIEFEKSAIFNIVEDWMKWQAWQRAVDQRSKKRQLTLAAQQAKSKRTKTR